MYLTLDKINELLEKSDFGFYKLYNESTREIVAGSHVDQDNEGKAITSKDLIKHFNERIEILAYGRYKIVLKKMPTGKDEHSATYRFEVLNSNMAGTPVQQVSNTHGHISFDEYEKKITQAREDAYLKAKAEFDNEIKLKDLQRQIEELKAGQKNNTGEIVNQVFEKTVQLGTIITAMIRPDKTKLLEQALGIVNAQEEDEEEVPVRQVIRRD